LTLVSLMLNQPGLSWQNPSSHVETFAGMMSVTKGEWQDVWVKDFVWETVFVQYSLGNTKPKQMSLQIKKYIIIFSSPYEC